MTAPFSAFVLTPVKTISTFALFLCLALGFAGCSTPSTPSVVGINKFHDITQVRKGMSPNEVRRVMGSDYKNEMQEGIRGMDGGYYSWVYPEGRVNFNVNGVVSVD